MATAVAHNLRRSRCGEASSLGTGRRPRRRPRYLNSTHRHFLSPESRWCRRGPKGRIELTGLLGLHLARRGFWGAIFAKARRRDQWTWRIAQVYHADSSPRRAKRAVVAWEQARARPRIAVWRRLGFFNRENTELRTTLLRTIPAQKRTTSKTCEDKSIARRLRKKIRKIRPRSPCAPHRRRDR